MKIGIASAIAGIPTKKNLTAYGGIERVVSGLSKAFQDKGHETIVAGYTGTDCGDVNIELNAENDLAANSIDCDILFDFSHYKLGIAKTKYSIPMYSDQIGSNPIFPSYAVKNSFKYQDGDVAYMGIQLPQLRKVSKTNDYCYVGRISRIKGLDLLEYLIQNEDLKISIAGYVDGFDKDYALRFIDMAKSYGCEVKTDVEYETIIDTLAKSKYFIFSPSWHVLFGNGAVESFGLAAVEALSQNTTVLTSNISSGVIEIIRNNGYILDGITDWAKFLKSPKPPIPDLYKYAENFSSDAYADRLSRIVHIQ